MGWSQCGCTLLPFSFLILAWRHQTHSEQSGALKVSLCWRLLWAVTTVSTQKEPPKTPVFLCTTSRRAATWQRAPCSLWRTYVSMFTAASGPTPGALALQKQLRIGRIVWRWIRVGKCEKCKFQRVVLLYPGWITSRHMWGTKAAAAGTKDPASFSSPGLVRSRNCWTN